MMDWSDGPYWVLVKLGPVALAGRPCKDPATVVQTLESPPTPEVMGLVIGAGDPIALQEAMSLTVVCRHEKAQRELHPVIHEAGWCTRCDLMQETNPMLN